MARPTKVIFISGELEEGIRFRNLFQAHFKGSEFYHVTDESEAEQHLEQLNGVSLIIIDAALRVDDLSTFFLNMCNKNNNYPIIFYGTEAFLKSRVPDNMYDYNMASGLLLRPLNANDFLSSVNRSLGWVREKEVKEATVDLDAEHFIPFRVRSFYRLESVDYPVFMQITHHKYIRILEAKEKYTHDQMHKYVRKGVRYLYFEKKDYLLFLSESMRKLMELLEDPTCSFELQAKAQIQGCMIIQEYARTIGLNDGIVEFINILINSIQKNVQQAESLKKILSIFPFNERDVYDRSILSAYIALYIISELEWQSELTIQKLGVSALFYDAMVSNDEMLKYTSIEEVKLSELFEEDEVEEFKLHPVRAAELIRLSQGLAECDFIIQQHHERPDGKGYPQGLVSHQITGIVAIFNMSTEFAHRLCFYGISKKSIQTIMDEFFLLYNTGNFKEPLHCLSRMLGEGGIRRL